MRSPGLAVAAVLVLTTSGLAGRAAIVAAVPQAAAVYAFLGLPVNLTGLAFSDVSSTLTERDGQRVLSLKAQVANVAGKPRPVPPVEIVIRGPAGEALYTWSVMPPKPSLEAGERMDVNARLASPPAKGERVDLQFTADRADTTVASLSR
jgi:hypothetical protein